jgi:anti-sigma factor RsiW
MTCDDYQENVSQLLDGELLIGEEPALFRHLGDCDSCRTFLKAVLQLRHALLVSQPVRVSEKADHAIARRLGKAGAAMPDRGAVHIWRRRVSIRLPVAAVAAAFLITFSIVISSMVAPVSRPATAERVVYVMTLPTVDVVGHKPNDTDDAKGRRQ